MDIYIYIYTYILYIYIYIYIYMYYIYIYVLHFILFVQTFQSLTKSCAYSSFHSRILYEDLIEDWNVCINTFKLAMIKDI